MSRASLYDSLQIAHDFVDQANQLAREGEYDAAYLALEKAKSYAFNNEGLLNEIELRHTSLKTAQTHHIKELEAEAAALFNQDRFDGQKARQLLQTLLNQNGRSEMAHSLWAELPTREAAEQERHLIEDFQSELEKTWQRARDLEDIGAGSRAMVEYERAVIEASKKAGDMRTSIPLQRLKLQATEKRDQAKEKWVGVPTLILAQKGQELVDRYEALKEQGDIEAEFFDENGEFLGRLPIEECIDRAKKMASRFAEQKAQDYLGQARDLLVDSPGAAYEKIQDALAIAHPSDFAKSILERELEEKIRPAMQRREKALAQLEAALSKEEPTEAWATLREIETIDEHTPGLTEAHQRLLPVLEQKFNDHLERGRQLQQFEDFEAAQARLQEAISIGQMVFGHGTALQELYSKAQEAFEACVQLKRETEQFEQRLQDIAEQSQIDPNQAREQLAKLTHESLSSQATAKVERLKVQIDFKIGADALFRTLEEKMLAASDVVDLIPVEEGARQGMFDYPAEERFPNLVDRISARRAYLRGVQLREDPSQLLEARDFLQEVLDSRGDDAAAAKQLLEELEDDEQRENEILLAVQEAKKALEKDDFRSAFLLLEPYRHTISRQVVKVREAVAIASSRWWSELDQQLESLIATGDFSLPRIELLLQDLERSQSPRLTEWQTRVLAPAYANTAWDLQKLNRWDQAAVLWEEAFKLAPSDPGIIEGRRNSKKYRALIQAQMTFEPAERERLLNDLNRVYDDDPVIKRYLAEFYYSEGRFIEARLAISQIKFLTEQEPTSINVNDIEAIQRVEQLIEEAEKIEKRKFAIRSQITGETSIRELREARLALEQLLEIAPEQQETLQDWWEELIKETVAQMKSQVGKLSGMSGTALTRAELLCKILALQVDSDTQAQAERMLKLTYNQLPADIETVVNNPEGVGFGPPAQALGNHIAKAKDLYVKLVNLNQVERIATDLGLDLEEHNLDLNHILYQLELTLEQLYYVHEKQLDIKNQIVVALMTGQWEAIKDSIKELEAKGLNDHRGTRALPQEVDQARDKRRRLETTGEHIKKAMAKEAYKIVQKGLDYLAHEDPLDETHIQISLDVSDSFTGLRIKGAENLKAAISEKYAMIELLNDWVAGCKPTINWPPIQAKMTELGSQGDFDQAIELGLAALGQREDQHLILGDDGWSFKQARQHFESLPVAKNQLNSSEAQTLYKQIQQQRAEWSKLYEACHAITQDLQQRQREFTQIINDLTPLVEQLQESKNGFASILTPPTQSRDVKFAVIDLIKQGRQLCPNYPAFINLDDNLLRT